MSNKVLPSLRPALSALVPSFFSHRLKPRRLHPTSYLDGLRGIAALFVVVNHYGLQYYPDITKGWRDSKDSWIQLPFIRLIHNGRFSVTIFFVISGYVLSHKALGLSRQHHFNSFSRNLASSVFRRWLRLMLPSIASSFLVFLMVRLNLGNEISTGWSGRTLEYEFENKERGYAGAAFPERMNSVGAQFWHWWDDVSTVYDPFRFGTIVLPKYNGSLWTIQVEFMGSMLVFVTTLATGYLHPRFRILLPSFLVLYCYMKGAWIWLLFISGMVFAELSYIRADLPPSKITTLMGERMQKALSITAFIICIYLGSYPDREAAASYGYGVFASPSITWLYPAAFRGNLPFFYAPVAAVLGIFVLETSKPLQAIFTSEFAQYCGDISLSIYMLHQCILLSLGNWIVPMFVHGLGSFFVGMAISWTICAMVTVCAADLFWRLVDVKTVRLARYVADACFIPEDDRIGSQMASPGEVGRSNMPIA